MDSSRRIHEYEDTTPDRPAPEKLYRDRLITRLPMPEECNAERVLRALEKFSGCTELPPLRDATMFLLTPFERGYVLGILSASPGPTNNEET